MRKEDITKIAKQLRRRCGTLDPYALCKLLDIRIVSMSMGLTKDSIKGFIQKNNRCYCIIVNSDLDEMQQEFIIFHEVGHMALEHLQGLACAFRDNYVYDNSGVLENEANLFVAEFLLDTEETLNLIRDGRSFFEVASLMHVTPEILDFKWRMLQYYKLIQVASPVRYNSDCMKNLTTGLVGDDYA